MRTLGKHKRTVFYNKFRDKTLEILIEGKQNKTTNLLKGITSNYIPVSVKGEDKLKNTIVNVTINEVSDSNQVFGTIS